MEAEKPQDSDDEHLAKVPPARKENPEEILRRQQERQDKFKKRWNQSKVNMGMVSDEDARNISFKPNTMSARRSKRPHRNDLIDLDGSGEAVA